MEKKDLDDDFDYGTDVSWMDILFAFFGWLMFVVMMALVIYQYIKGA